MDNLNVNSQQSEQSQQTNFAMDDNPAFEKGAEQTQPPIQEPEVNVAPTYPEYIDIGGEQVKFEEVRNGYLRQSDYTRKTSELARQREEAQDALELVEYIRANQELANMLLSYQSGQGTPEVNTPVQQQQPQFNSSLRAVAPKNEYEERIKNLERTIHMNELDRNIASLKSKYSDFDEALILTRANELGIRDLETVYYAMKGMNQINNINSQVNQALMNHQKVGQYEQQINQSMIGGADVSNDTSSIKLSPQEQYFADIFGMSAEEYHKYK